MPIPRSLCMSADGGLEYHRCMPLPTNCSEPLDCMLKFLHDGGLKVPVSIPRRGGMSAHGAVEYHRCINLPILFTFVEKMYSILVLIISILLRLLENFVILQSRSIAQFFSSVSCKSAQVTVLDSDGDVEVPILCNARLSAHGAWSTTASQPPPSTVHRLSACCKFHSP